MTYPATFSVDSPERIDNWRPFVQWILSIPHFVVLYVLGIVGFIVAVISWFSIVFTGRFSEGLASTQAMVQRYQTRTIAYAGFLHTEYPPFDFTSSASEPGGTPVTVDYHPALDGRDRMTVGLRFLWMIPAAIFAWAILVAAQILWLISAFIVLFTGAWQEGMRDFVVKAVRLSVKVNAYGALLTDEYPPFSLDD